MALLESIRPTGYGHRVGTHLRSLASQLIDNVIAWNLTRITRNELSRLSDEQLDDIGLTREEIGSIRN